MSKFSIGFALVGCGRISKKYVTALSDGSVSGARLVAVCDIIDDKMRAHSEKYGIPGFTDMHEMMRSVGDSVDVIVILTESGNHSKHCVELSRYKKYLVVEKPMALTLDDADRMIRACDSMGVTLFVVKQNRYNKPVVKLREAIDSGRLGQIIMGTVRVRWARDQNYYDEAAWRGTRALDGGVFDNQASHHIDLLRWCLGEPISVFAYGTTALVNIEAEDTGVAVIKFKSGALGIVEATNATRPSDLEGSLSILGSKGSVEIGGFAVNELKTWKFLDETPEDAIVLEEYSENPPNVYGFGHVAYLQDVVKAIKHNTPSVVDGLAGREALELITSIHQSIDTGLEVSIVSGEQFGNPNSIKEHIDPDVDKAS